MPPSGIPPVHFPGSAVLGSTSEVDPRSRYAGRLPRTCRAARGLRWRRLVFVSLFPAEGVDIVHVTGRYGTSWGSVDGWVSLCDAFSPGSGGCVIWGMFHRNSSGRRVDSRRSCPMRRMRGQVDGDPHSTQAHGEGGPANCEPDLQSHIPPHASCSSSYATPSAEPQSIYPERAPPCHAYRIPTTWYVGRGGCGCGGCVIYLACNSSGGPRELLLGCVLDRDVPFRYGERNDAQARSILTSYYSSGRVGV